MKIYVINICYAIFILVCSSLVQGNAASHFVEDFGGDSLSHMQLGPNPSGAVVDFTGDFTVTSGAGSRIYLATQDTDYSLVDFVFTADVFVPTGSSWSYPFFGMGNAIPNDDFYFEPSLPNLALSFSLSARDNTDNGSGIINYSVPFASSLRDATHNMIMIWDASTKNAEFQFDWGNDGSVEFRTILDGSDNGFNSLNSSLFVGGGNGVTFDNISVSIASSIPDAGSSLLLLGLGLITCTLATFRRKLPNHLLQS